MEIKCMPKDLINLSLSYLSNEEMIYIKGEQHWTEFPQDSIYKIGNENCWYDLLEWYYIHYLGSGFACHIAAFRGNINFLKWLYKKGYKINSDVCNYIDIIQTISL